MEGNSREKTQKTQTWLCLWCRFGAVTVLPPAREGPGVGVTKRHENAQKAQTRGALAPFVTLCGYYGTVFGGCVRSRWCIGAFCDSLWLFLKTFATSAIFASLRFPLCAFARLAPLRFPLCAFARLAPLRFPLCAFARLAPWSLALTPGLAPTASWERVIYRVFAAGTVDRNTVAPLSHARGRGVGGEGEANPAFLLSRRGSGGA